MIFSRCQGAALDVTNAPNDFTLNFNDTDQAGNNFSIVGVGGAGDTATINYGVPDTVFAAGSTGEFVSQNIDNLNINVTSLDDHNFYSNTGASGGIEVVANEGSAEVLTINTDSAIQIGVFAAGDVVVGTSSLTLFGGTLLAPTTGTLDITGTGPVAIGVTNASVIDDTGLNLTMFAPGNDITIPGYTGIDVTAASAGSVLSGTVGTETLVPALGATAFTAIVGNDTLTDTAGSTIFWGDGGSDTITMGLGANTTFFGSILAGPTFQNQLITNATDQAYQGFWGVANGTGPTTISAALPGMVTLDGGITGGTSASNTTITGFNFTDTPQDNLHFNVPAWAGAHAGTSGILVNGDGLVVGSGRDSVKYAVARCTGALLAPDTNVVLDGIGRAFGGPQDLASSLTAPPGRSILPCYWRCGPQQRPHAGGLCN